MHVIVNLQPLLSPLTGVGHYTRELTLALMALAPQPPAVEGIIGYRREALTPTHPLLQVSSGMDAAAPGQRSRVRKLARRYIRNRLTRRLYRQLCTYRLQHAPRPADAIYWEPNYVLLPWQGPSVVTVHDLSHQRYPEYHPAERVRFLERHLPNSLSRATRINVVSRFSARELQTLHGIDPARIDIVSPAVSARFFAPLTTERKQAIRRRHMLPERYLLSVGTLEPRKNLARVLEAYAALPVATQAAAPLLLAGMQGWGSSNWSARVEQAFQRGHIRRLGYVPDADLPGLYAMAQGFVYVSLYEGFGMPVVEAMAAGAPVLTAAATATAEVSAGAGLEVHPRDTEAIRHGLSRLLDETHTERIAAGRARAQQFSWQASAQQLSHSLTGALSS